MKITKPKITEAQIQKSILQYLTLKGVVHFRLNSGAIKTQTGGFVRLAKTGTPDILALPQRWDSDKWDTTPIFFEVKRPGAKLTDAQQAMHKELERDGFIVMTVCDMQVVIDTIEILITKQF